MGTPDRHGAVDWGIGRYERTAELLLPAARALVESAAVAAGERVLDLGCGTGNAALLAAELGAHVTAVDPSPRLLGVTGAAARGRGLHLRCELGDAAALPVLDRSFDCVLSNFGLIFASRPEDAVTEIARVLEGDGRAVFTAWLPGGAVGAMVGAAQDLVRSALGAPAAPPGFPWHDQGALKELFARVGMEVASRGIHEIVFTADSPEAYLDAEQDNHPLAVAGMQVLQQRGEVERGRAHLLHVLTDQNEDPDAFRSTSRYVVFAARRAQGT